MTKLVIMTGLCFRWLVQTLQLIPSLRPCSTANQQQPHKILSTMVSKTPPCYTEPPVACESTTCESTTCSLRVRPENVDIFLWISLQMSNYYVNLFIYLLQSHSWEHLHSGTRMWNGAFIWLVVAPLVLAKGDSHLCIVWSTLEPLVYLNSTPSHVYWVNCWSFLPVQKSQRWM